MEIAKISKKEPVGIAEAGFCKPSCRPTNSVKTLKGYL